MAAIRMVDIAKGTEFAPADWTSPQPSISNTKAGVLKYYADKYKEEKQKKDIGLFAALREKFVSFYESIFGVASAIEEPIKDKKGAEDERFHDALSQEDIFTTDSKSLKSGKDTLEEATAGKDTLEAGDGKK